MPYRVDLPQANDDALETLVRMGALDVEAMGSGLAALMPDSAPPPDVARALGVQDVPVAPAVPRDGGSVWVLRPRPIQIGPLRILPVDADSEPDALRLLDTPVFGSGLHPTTALCIEAIHDAAQILGPEALLDVGTGSGVLALAALTFGVPRALAIDVDADALRVAAEHARMNGLESRLQLLRAEPEALAGTWPLVVANILAAPLIEMAPALVRRVGCGGRLVLSGIPRGVGAEVERAYVNLGMRRRAITSRAGWVALVMDASW